MISNEESVGAVRAIVELGWMGIKPGLDIMDGNTREGQILMRTYQSIMAAPGGPLRINLGVDDETNGRPRLWAFFDWSSIDDHERFAKSFGAEAVKDLPQLFTQGDFTKHVVLSRPLLSFPQSPVIHVMLAYFSSVVSITEEEAGLVSQFQKYAGNAFGKHDALHATSYGWGSENDFPVPGTGSKQIGSILIAFGHWSSLDAYADCRRTIACEKNIRLIEAMKGVERVEVFALECKTFVGKAE